MSVCHYRVVSYCTPTYKNNLIIDYYGREVLLVFELGVCGNDPDCRAPEMTGFFLNNDTFAAHGLSCRNGKKKSERAREAKIFCLVFLLPVVFSTCF